jgi:2-C-methyl-D-erythritol 4-phosphate cytidylyltransferase
MHVTAIIVAAGAGRRIGGPSTKTYLPVAGRPLILRTLDRIFQPPPFQMSCWSWRRRISTYVGTS